MGLYLLENAQAHTGLSLFALNVLSQLVGGLVAFFIFYSSGSSA